MSDDKGCDCGARVDSSVRRLMDRLFAAEAVCLMYGWSPIHDESQREKATSELWRRWCEVVGDEFLEPEAHQELRDSEAELAAVYDRRHEATLEAIRS